jgi:hypothetical protein
MLRQLFYAIALPICFWSFGADVGALFSCVLVLQRRTRVR